MDEVTPRPARALLREWKDIAEALDVSVDSVQRYAARNVDPLPVVYDHACRPSIFVSALQDWVDRNTHAFAAYHAMRAQGVHPSQLQRPHRRTTRNDAGAAARSSVIKRPKKAAEPEPAEQAKTEGEG